MNGASPVRGAATAIELAYCIVGDGPIVELVLELGFTTRVDLL